MRPKFEVGEEVILQSRTHPQANGEYVVGSVFKLDLEEKIATDIETGKRWTFKSLDGTYSYDVGNILNGPQMTMVEEIELRKKHKPSRMSFDNLMSSLKSPVNS